MNKKKLCFGLCIIGITLLYIFWNSLQPVVQSNEQSRRVLEVIEEVFNTPPLDTEEAQHIVRKAAHVVEFALLGMEMVLLLFVARKMSWGNLTTVLFIGLISAVTDETIQVFSQRGSQVLDVWIDFAGLMMGIGIGAAAHALVRSVRRYVRKQKHTAIKNMHIYQYGNEQSS